MDRVSEYRRILRRLIEEYARYKPSHGQIDMEAVIDAGENHFELMQVGWDGPRRIHGSVIHLDLIDGKVWLQFNGTNQLIAEELVEAGIPAHDIVLGFQTPDIRRHSGFAVA